jgi:hypothetical protein
MIVQSFKCAAWMTVAGVFAVACSKTPPPETAYASADLVAVASLCPQAGATVLDVGAQSASTFPQTFTDGEQGLSLNCRVSPNGDGFDLQLDAKSPGASGGELTISGHVTTADNGGKVTAQFVSQSAGAAFESADCAVTYTYNGQPIPANQRASGGSFFGHISCPMMMEPGTSISGQQVTGPDGGPVNAVCDGEADILFQNCDQ